MASTGDKFKKARRKFTTTVGAGGISSGGTVLPLNSTAGIDSDTAVIVTVDAYSPDGKRTPDQEEVIVGVLSGSQLVNCLRGLESTAAQAHAAGAVVTMYFTESHWDSLIQGLLVEHKQDGTHANIHADAITTNSLTIGSQDVSQIAVPTGTIAMWLGTTPPSGWLFLDGATYNKADYQNLWFRVSQNGSKLGTVTSTTFTLTSMGDYVPVGKNPNGGDFGTLGDIRGAYTANLAHSHSTDVQGFHSHGGQTGGGNAGGVYSGNDTNSAFYSNHQYHIHGIAGDGAHGHNISTSLGNVGLIQPSRIINFMVKA